MTRKDILEGIAYRLICAVVGGWYLFCIIILVLWYSACTIVLCWLCSIVIAHFIINYW